MPAATARRLSLLHKLDAALTHRLLLLVGSPRLTDRLLQRWMDRQPAPAAGVSLTAADNAPEIFLADVAAALEPVARMADGQGIGGMFDAGGEMADLINRLAGSPGEFLLLLRNYDVIRAQAVHRMVGLLVDWAPPAAHLVLTAGQEPPLPLARWRARRQVAVVRLPSTDLRRESRSPTRKT